nr:reverse transcriptase domain-containing protein [Tanacetum cinerariifolium]
MADQRTMAELLRAPTEGYAEVIVVPPILVEHFELKHSLINMMTSDQFFRLKKDNPHDHIRGFNKITSTIKYKDVPNSAIKLMFFPFSLARAARRWHEKEPPRSILTWEDFVSKFINEFFPPSRTKNFQNEVSNFQQHPADRDSFNSAAGGNLLERRTQDVLTPIKNKSKVRNSRNKSIVSQVKSSDVNSCSSSKIDKLTHAVNQQTSAVITTMTTILKEFQATPPPASVKAIEKIFVTSGGAHPYYQCLTTDGNTFPKFRDNIQGYVSAAAVQSGFFQMHTASTSGSGPLPSNTIANPKGELKAITTRSGLVLDGPFVPMPPPFINPKEDEREEETLMDSKLAEYTIKVPPLLVQKAKPPSLRNYVVHQRDPLHPRIPYPSRMNQEKQQEKNKIQIHKFWQMFKQLHINITLADALILIPKYQKMLKSLLSNKEKLLELENTPLNENCSAVILKKLPEKLRDPGKFLIPCGFSKLKCKALADLCASINLMPLSVWKKLDVFVPVGKFTFLADFVIVDYESDPRVPLILGRPFLWTARALIDVYGEEMIIRDGDERLTLNMRHDTSSYSNQPHKESINIIDIYNDSYEDYLEDLFVINHLSGNPTFSSHTDLTSPDVINPLIDECNLGDPNNDLVDTIPEMFTDEHTLDYSSPPLYNDVDDDLVELESDNDDVYDDPFDSKEDKIKEYKLLIDELDPSRSSDFLSSPEYGSVLYEDFSKVDALPSTNNEDKVFNPGILIHKNLFEVTIRVTPDKNVKKISISNASLILEDFNPPLYELPFHKEVLGSETLLSFSSKNEKKVFNPGILTSKGVHTSLLSELSHQCSKAFKVIKNLKSRWRFFLALIERTFVFWMFCVSIFIPHKQLNSRDGSSLVTLNKRFVGGNTCLS